MQIFENEEIIELISNNVDLVVPIVAPVIQRGSASHWHASM